MTDSRISSWIPELDRPPCRRRRLMAERNKPQLAEPSEIAISTPVSPILATFREPSGGGGGMAPIQFWNPRTRSSILIKSCASRRVDAPESPDLARIPPSRARNRCHVLTEMLDRPDPCGACTSPAPARDGIVDNQDPSGVPARNKVGHVRPRQRLTGRRTGMHSSVRVCLPARTRRISRRWEIAPGREPVNTASGIESPER